MDKLRKKAIYRILLHLYSDLYQTMKLAIIFATLFALSACGFKGDLYLPHDDDDATFSPIQTGVGLKPPVSDELKGNENAE